MHWGFVSGHVFHRMFDALTQDARTISGRYSRVDQLRFLLCLGLPIDHDCCDVAGVRGIMAAVGQRWLALLGLCLVFIVDAQYQETGGTHTRQLRRNRKKPPKEVSHKMGGTWYSLPGTLTLGYESTYAAILGSCLRTRVVLHENEASAVHVHCLFSLRRSRAGAATSS